MRSGHSTHLPSQSGSYSITTYYLDYMYILYILYYFNIMYTASYHDIRGSFNHHEAIFDSLLNEFTLLRS